MEAMIHRQTDLRMSFNLISYKKGCIKIICSKGMDIRYLKTIIFIKDFLVEMCLMDRVV